MGSLDVFSNALWDHEPLLPGDVGALANRTLLLPLPKGEGWGEGEVSTDNYSPRFRESLNVLLTRIGTMNRRVVLVVVPVLVIDQVHSFAHFAGFA
jgi:hypothetical protein